MTEDQKAPFKKISTSSIVVYWRNKVRSLPKKSVPCRPEFGKRDELKFSSHLDQYLTNFLANVGIFFLKK
jgi:hypothetical protein